MTRDYLVLRNGLLYTRCITIVRAKAVVEELRKQGFNAAVAYDLQGGE